MKGDPNQHLQPVVLPREARLHMGPSHRVPPSIFREQMPIRHRFVDARPSTWRDNRPPKNHPLNGVFGVVCGRVLLSPIASRKKRLAH